MRIIDRYLLRMDVRSFLIFFLSLTGLYVVFDAFSNIDEFLKNNGDNGNLMLTMGRYYAYRAVFLFDRTSGILGLLAAMFTVAGLQRQNELTALWAAGISNRRLILPLLGFTAMLALAASANRELVIPLCRSELIRESKDLNGDQPQPMDYRYDNATDILLRGKFTIASKLRITEPDFLLPAELAVYGRNLVAEDAYYQPPGQGRPGGYLLKNLKQPAELKTKPGVSLGDKPVILTHQDHPDWIGEGECFVVSDLTFPQLTRGASWRSLSSTPELVHDLGNPSLDYGADVRVKIHGRVVQPLLDMTLLMLGLPLVMTPNNRRLFLAAGLAMGLIGVFMMVSMACQHMGTISLISPALAAWLPAIIFVPIAAALSPRIWD